MVHMDYGIKTIPLSVYYEYTTQIGGISIYFGISIEFCLHRDEKYKPVNHNTQKYFYSS